MGSLHSQNILLSSIQPEGICISGDKRCTAFVTAVQERILRHVVDFLKSQKNDPNLSIPIQRIIDTLTQNWSLPSEVILGNQIWTTVWFGYPNPYKSSSNCFLNVKGEDLTI